MSDDESCSTDISGFSELLTFQDFDILEEWPPDANYDKNLIGNFMLNLYHRSIITSDNDWCVEKAKIHEEYSQRVSEEQKQTLLCLTGTNNIGSMLKRFDFLLNINPESTVYKIKYETLLDFRYKKKKELDKLNKLGELRNNTGSYTSSLLFNLNETKSIILEDNSSIDENQAKLQEQTDQEFIEVNFPIRPWRSSRLAIFKSFAYAEFFPQKAIFDALNGPSYHNKLMKECSAFRNYVQNGMNLQPETMSDCLNILLQIEEVQVIQQYRRLSQRNVRLRRYGEEYILKLESKQMGNALGIGDELILSRSADIDTMAETLLMLDAPTINSINKMYVGLIQEVDGRRVRFKCGKNLQIRYSYTVICRPCRLNFRYKYFSLLALPGNMVFLKKFLFPDKIIPMPLSTMSLNLYNKNINAEQLQAVRNIAEGPRNDGTYIIFGPPGTGKTATLVEAILQVLKRPGTKIVVSASSNAACDEIALRLCKYFKQFEIKRGMIRIYSRSFVEHTKSIDHELLKYSNIHNGHFYPDVKTIHEYRIVICTLSLVGKLATAHFGSKENMMYTHLFIDEVAASMEAETLMAIITVLKSESCLIISGDNKQLGPILQSQRAKKFGLAATMMDRLLTLDCYRVDADTGDYDRTIQTRLVQNYRSHPTIVKLFSNLYYNDSLKASANLDDVALGSFWHKSRNKQFPILFHATYEPYQCDKYSFSLYNRKEIYVVMDYVKDLMYFGINGEPVKESDIGIISPYKKQYKLIQQELDLRKWFGIKTGSVEKFQGKERNIIIVSYVRSGTENLGFLDCPRRLNVTISRAKSLLILIGNPITLSLNSDFEYIIKECKRNNTFVDSNDPSVEDIIKQSTENLANSQESLSQLEYTDDDDDYSDAYDSDAYDSDDDYDDDDSGDSDDDKDHGDDGARWPF